MRVELHQRPWNTCFYSYRGGVGRTTLAASSAYILVNDDDGPVLLLDMDLEAPGIDEFDLFAPPSAEQPGLVEYIDEYRNSEVAPGLGPYVYRAKRGKAGTIFKGEYPLLIMRAGRKDADYRRILSQFDWPYFFRAEQGEDFFANFCVGALCEFGCRHILVDSRTGLTDIGGVCTGLLADAVVLVFHPTSAHAQGLMLVAQSIREREQLEQRSIPRLYVASRVQVPFEHQIDPDMLGLAYEVFRECEGFAPTEEHIWESIWQPDECFDFPSVPDFDASTPRLAFVRHRERVRGAHRPDTFIVFADLRRNGREVGGYTEYEEENFAVATWIQRVADSEYLRAATKIVGGLIHDLRTKSLSELGSAEVGSHLCARLSRYERLVNRDVMAQIVQEQLRAMAPGGRSDELSSGTLADACPNDAIIATILNTVIRQLTGQEQDSAKAILSRRKDFSRPREPWNWRGDDLLSDFLSP